MHMGPSMPPCPHPHQSNAHKAHITLHNVLNMIGMIGMTGMTNMIGMTNDRCMHIATNKMATWGPPG